MTTTTFAVMLMDLDRFKEVNDTLGHPYGDELLQAARARLASVRRCPMGLVARLGGDEFAVLSGRTTDRDAYIKLVGRLLRSRRAAARGRGAAAQVGASIGIAVFPQ